MITAHTTPSVPTGTRPLRVEHVELIKLLAAIAVEDYLLGVEHLNEEQSAVKEVSNHAVR